MEAEKVIELQDVCFGYEANEVLHHISLTLHRGDFAAMVGPNGGGKTTLLRLILGLLTPRYGTVRVLGQAPEKVRRHIGYVPQHLLFDMQFPASVLDVVLMGRVERCGFGRYGHDDKAKAAAALEKVGLEGYGSRAFSQLSGGERQRVLIAQTLASEPKLLLLDEPGANLDPANRHRIFALLHQLNQELTILLVSHNLNVVSSYVSHVICVNRMADMHAIGEIHVNALADGDWLSIEHIQCPVTTPPQECDHTL